MIEVMAWHRPENKPLLKSVTTNLNHKPEVKTKTVVGIFLEKRLSAKLDRNHNKSESLESFFKRKEAIV